MSRDRLTTGAQMIAAERTRQRRIEGYSRTHDRDHSDGELVRAAVVYAMPPEPDGGDVYRRFLKLAFWPAGWTFKPSPDARIHELVKAGALIAAEIDRLRDGQ